MVTVMLIVTGALGTVSKGLVRRLEELEIRGQAETIQTTSLFNEPEYWEESWKLEETWCQSDFSERPSANAGVKSHKY